MLGVLSYIVTFFRKSRILSDTNKSMKPYIDIADTAEKSAMRMFNR